MKALLHWLWFAPYGVLYAFFAVNFVWGVVTRDVSLWLGPLIVAPLFVPATKRMFVALRTEARR